jgi:hypothetical protein
MPRPGLDVFQTFNEVGLAVKRATGGRQQPWVSSSPIDGNFYFVAPPGTDIPALGSTAAPSSASTDVRRFDGIWIGKLVCKATPSGVPGWQYELVGRATNGSFHAECGMRGEPGSDVFDGKIELGGAAEISQAGFSPETEKDAFHRPTGTPIHNTYLGNFDQARGTFTRSDRPSCTIDFAKQLTSADTVAVATTAAPALPAKQKPTGVPQPAVSTEPQAAMLSSTPSQADSRVPAVGIRRFDGVWVGALACNDLPFRKREFAARVTNSTFHVQLVGEEGRPGSQKIEGTVKPDGTVAIVNSGLSGETETDPFHRPKGTPFRATFVGSLEASYGKLVRLDRPCTIEISRLMPPSAEKALEPATAPVSPALTKGAHSTKHR